MNEFEKQVTELANEAAKEMVNAAPTATTEIVTAAAQHSGIPVWAAVVTGVSGLGLGLGAMKLWDKFVTPKLQERKLARQIAKEALKAQREAKRQAAMAAASQAQAQQQPAPAQAQIDPNAVNPTING